MQLRALGLDSKVYKFTVQDCPVSIGKDITALTAKPGSKLLYTDTVTRCGDGRYAEGDRVYRDGKFSGCVIYAGGFLVYNHKTNEYRPIEEGKDYIKLGTRDTMRSVACNPKRTRMTLKVSGQEFELNGIVCYYRDGIGCVTSRMFSDAYVDLKSIQHTTGVTVNGQTLYYGDDYMGGKVILKDGMPTVKKEDGTLMVIK